MKINTNIKFNYKLHEAYNNGLQMVILDNKGNIRHKPVRCKDYFQDLYWSEKIIKNKIEQYGFQWDGNNNKPISKQKWVYLGLLPDDKLPLINTIYNTLKLLNCVEEHFNIPFTTFQIDKLNKLNIILKYSNKWSEKLYLLSLFFLLVRCSEYYNYNYNINNIYKYLNEDILGKLINQADKNSLFALSKTNGLKKILLNKKRPDINYKDYQQLYNVHNNSGIVNISQKYYG